MTNIGIHRIRENEHVLNLKGLQEIEREKLTITHSIGFRYDLSKKEFDVKLTTIYNSKFEVEDRELFRFGFITTFFVSDLDKQLVPTENGFELDDDIMINFVSTTLGIARGLVFAKLSGTLLNDCYLPLISTKKFMENSGMLKKKPIHKQLATKAERSNK